MSLRISNKHGILQYKKKNGHSSGFINEHAQHAEGKGVVYDWLNAQIILMRAQIIPHPHKHNIRNIINPKILNIHLIH